MVLIECARPFFLDSNTLQFQFRTEKAGQLLCKHCVVCQCWCVSYCIGNILVVYCITFTGNQCRNVG